MNCKPMSTHQFSLAGRKALVTGASRGIGRAIAEGLAAAGADVAIAARNVEAIGDCAKTIYGLGRVSHAVHMDVSDVGNCRRGVAEAAEKLGGLDILVNNAGVEQVCPRSTSRRRCGIASSTPISRAPSSRPGGGPPDEGRRHPQPLLAHLRARRSDRRSLWLVEERPPRHDARARRRMGAARHPRQRAGARLFPHRTHRGVLSERGLAGGDARQYPHAPLRRA